MDYPGKVVYPKGYQGFESLSLRTQVLVSDHVNAWYTWNMFDHITLIVKDIIESKAFYGRVLLSLGLKELYGKDGEFCGFGDTRPVFWIVVSDASHKASAPVHIAFSGTSKEQVEVFYHAAIAAGARDNGKPGYHIEYDAGYYAGFVFDPDGNNIEVVYRDPNHSVTS